MALAYQFGIPKEKGNDHTVGTREIQSDQVDDSFIAGRFVAISSEESKTTTPKIKNFAAATDTPAGIMIKVDITKESASICLSGRAVPVLSVGALAAGDELELTEEGKVQKLSSGQFIGVCSKANIKAMNQNGVEMPQEACLIDFEL